MNNKGQTLIEVLVAFAIGSVIVIAITTVVIAALNNAEYSKNQTYANLYIQQGMDIIRHLRDNNYTEFSNFSGNYCLASTCTSLNSTIGDPCGPMSISCPQNVGIFIRQVKITQNSPNCSKGGSSSETDVQTTVSWSDNKCTNASNVFCHQITAETCFSNFGVQSVP